MRGLPVQLRKECWAATHQSRVNLLWIQKAARKQRWPSQKQGAWTGLIVETTEEGVFVTILQEKMDKCTCYWCQEVSEASSNYRDLLNLVESLEAPMDDRGIRGADDFLFTDNSTLEVVFFKGSSMPERLFKLMVLQLCQIEIKGDLLLHVIHMAGTRMIEEDADGGLRGDLLQGEMAGCSVINFVHLHLSALERLSKVGALDMFLVG
jgi:hypothetical protein